MLEQLRLGQYSSVMLILALIVVLTVAYLAARKPRKRPEGERQGLSRNELHAIMKHRAQDAVRSAKADFGKKLDFLPASVQEVEEILAALHRKNLFAPLDQQALTQESTKWGAYVGQVLKSVVPSDWEQDSAEAGAWSLPLVEKKSGQENFPVAWCRQRIVGGPEDSVWAKFCLLVADRDETPG